MAQIFGWVGWLTLIVGGLGLLALGSQLQAAFGPRGNGLLGLGAVASGAVPLLFLALGPFFLWALLTGLCELHAQGERTSEQLDDIRRSSAVAQGATPTAGILPGTPR